MSDTIYLIMGESGVGKDTIVNELCEKYNYKRVISYTTRPRRNDRNDNKSHIFISDDEFDSLKNLVAYTKFNDYRYGATQEQVDKADFYIIDCEGIDWFLEHYHGDNTVKVIYITAPEATRFLRMKERGQSNEIALERIQHDREAFKDANSYYDVVVDNDGELDESVSQIVSYISGR